MKEFKTTHNITSNPSRFYLLDLSRSIAALCVILQHYQLFYFLPDYTLPDNFLRSQQPFYEYIRFFYTFGSVAVQYFFVLSGFVFFSVYNDKVYHKAITLRNFFMLRFSRLYPLVILTLFFAAFLQLFYNELTNDYFIYKYNDIKHFILNIFLVNQWGFQDGDSFNGPAWSISIEVLLYASFFLFARIGMRNLLHVILVIILVIIFKTENLISQGFFCFYIGGITYYILLSIKKSLTNHKLQRIIIVLGLIILNILIFGGFLNPFFINHQENLEFFFGKDIKFLLFAIKFPLLILNLTIIQFVYPNIASSIKLLGDLSYTIYLVHFPVQVTFALINISFFTINYDSNITFLTFIFSVFLVSFLTFTFFEIPFKNVIRRKMIY
jgi:peptidoglycan/LPS O-acetylase OafA/YrhL